MYLLQTVPRLLGVGYSKEMVLADEPVSKAAVLHSCTKFLIAQQCNLTEILANRNKHGVTHGAYRNNSMLDLLGC